MVCLICKVVEIMELARHSDIDSIYDLICDLEHQQFDYQLFKQCFFRQLEDPRFKTIIHRNESNIVDALLSLRIETHLHHCAKIAEIVELVVSSATRGQGIGTMLVNEAIEYAKNNECVGITLVSNGIRVNAHHFYQQLGFNKSHVGFTYYF